MVFLMVKYIHILAAITAFGLNLSYAVWISKARREPAHTAFALSGVKYLDDRIANLAYGVLLLTGLLMVLLAPYPIITFWIDASVALYAVVAVLAIPATPRRCRTRSSWPKRVTRAPWSSSAWPSATSASVRFSR